MMILSMKLSNSQLRSKHNGGPNIEFVAIGLSFCEAPFIPRDKTTRATNLTARTRGVEPATHRSINLLGALTLKVEWMALRAGEHAECGTRPARWHGSQNIGGVPNRISTVALSFLFSELSNMWAFTNLSTPRVKSTSSATRTRICHLMELIYCTIRTDSISYLCHCSSK